MAEHLGAAVHANPRPVVLGSDHANHGVGADLRFVPAVDRREHPAPVAFHAYRLYYLDSFQEFVQHLPEGDDLDLWHFLGHDALHWPACFLQVALTMKFGSYQGQPSKPAQ